MRSKAELRTEARTIADVSGDESRRLRDHVIEMLDRARPQVVMLFLPMEGEADLRPLVDRYPEVTWVTSRTPGEGPLTLHTLDTGLETHRWGFQQPVEHAPRIEPDGIDLVLVPGVLFTRDGDRMGNGKGYYDRLFTEMRPDVVRVGITLERRLVEELPTESHDVRMTAVITESAVYEAGR